MSDVESKTTDNENIYKPVVISAVVSLQVKCHEITFKTVLWPVYQVHQPLSRSLTTFMESLMFSGGEHVTKPLTNYFKVSQVSIMKTGGKHVNVNEDKLGKLYLNYDRVHKPAAPTC